MSLPEFSTQSYLFSTAALSSSLFSKDDRYRLFATLVYPRLVKVRPQLTACYCGDDGRAAIEPVLLLRRLPKTGSVLSIVNYHLYCTRHPHPQLTLN
jgi:hypothetical protein